MSSDIKFRYNSFRGECGALHTNGKNRNAPFLINAGLIIIFIVLGFTVYQFASSSPRPDCTPEDLRCREIHQLEELLAKSKLSSDMQRSLTAKLQALYYEATSQAEGIQLLMEMPTEAELARKQLRTPKVTRKPLERLTGIIERPAVPLTQAFTITNAWQEIVDGRYIIVFAGALSDDPDQGVLIINDDLNDKYTIYTSPSKDGSLRIIAEDNFYLTLETTNKTKVYFDILHPTFPNSMNISEGPTITPFTFPTATSTIIPTINPYPSP